jgi:outer membrane autotransporter protein
MKNLQEKGRLLAIALGVMAASASEAALIELPPGQKFTVRDGDTIHEFNLVNSRLIIENGGETGRILANSGARIEMEGARVNSTGAPALALYNSHAVIAGSTIIANANPLDPSARAYGIRLSGIEQASSALVTDSFVSGIGRGINVTDSSTLLLVGTDVRGHAGAPGEGSFPGGVGVVVAGASGSFTQHSNVTGDNNGVVIFADATGAAEKRASLIVDESAVIGLEGSAILATKTAAADQQLDIDIRNGSILTGGNGIILEVEKSAIANFNVDNSQLSGDVVVRAGSEANLALNNNASLTGTITNATSLAIDKSSLWVMEQNSTVGKLNLNSGMVDLRGTDGNASFHQLNVKELSGDGQFALGTDLAAGSGDSLYVSGTASGSHKLQVENTGAAPQAGGVDRQLVHIADGDAQFAVDSEDGLVDAGAYSYSLQQRGDGGSGNDWFLVQTGTVSKSTEVAIGLFSAAPTVWYGESATLRSRMGELRTDSNQSGGWMRTYGNKYNMSAASGVQYSQQQQGISFGADLPITSSGGQWLMGLMGGYSKSDLDLKAGNKGKVDSYYVGAYSTWLADNGFYIDALIKANRFQNSADVTMRDGAKSKGDYNNYGVGASVEVGKHITFADDWFVEPYAQVSGLWVSGENYKLDNGLQASTNNADSLLGKAGSHAGRKFALDDGGFIQPYVKVGVAREFVTSNRVRVNESRFTNDLSGTRGELGLGVAAQLTDILQLHANYDYMKAQNIEQPWGVNVGVRYHF